METLLRTIKTKEGYSMSDNRLVFPSGSRLDGQFERLNHYRFVTQTRTEILHYITFYNAFQRHSTINYMSPMDFERKYMKQAA